MIEREEGVEEMLKKHWPYINRTPALLSILYDIDMMPEQCRTVIGAIRLSAFCEIWKRLEIAEAAAHVHKE